MRNGKSALSEQPPNPAPGSFHGIVNEQEWSGKSLRGEAIADLINQRATVEAVAQAIFGRFVRAIQKRPYETDEQALLRRWHDAQPRVRDEFRAEAEAAIAAIVKLLEQKKSPAGNAGLSDNEERQSRHDRDHPRPLLQQP